MLFSQPSRKSVNDHNDRGSREWASLQNQDPLTTEGANLLISVKKINFLKKVVLVLILKVIPESFPTGKKLGNNDETWAKLRETEGLWV